MLSIATVTVEIESVLLEVDGPQLVLAKDIIGTRYLCSLAKSDDDGDSFMAVQISDKRLQQFRSGLVDLRTVLMQPEMGLCFEGRFRRKNGIATIDLVAQPEAPEASLPSAGLLFTEFDDDLSDETVVRDAFAKNAAVIICRIDAPESRGTVSRIDAEHLAHYIDGFQSLVRHVGKRMRDRMGPAAKTVSEQDALTLQVYDVSPGSFSVHFESKDHADLFGGSVVGAAMVEVDDLMRIASLPADEFSQRIEPHKGNVLAAYKHLLKFVGRKDVPFSYRWAEPALNQSRGERITPVAAKAMVAFLESDTALTSEPFKFIGRFTSVNTDHPPLTWTARDSDLQRLNGQVDDGSKDVLNGVIIKTQQYVFEGDLRLVSSPTSPRPVLKRYLKSVTAKD